MNTTQKNSSFLVIGVSGHRNLHAGEGPRLRQHIDQWFASLKRRMPDTPLRIMVGMAQGADLLVARAALDAGWPVDAILPMPLEEYAKDFDQESAAALMTLLEHPGVRCTILDDAPAASAQHGAQRDALYARLMDALIEKCNLLLALWNGKPSSLPGGTADTVLRYLGARTQRSAVEQQVEIMSAAADAIWGPHFVYWIPTMRSDDAGPPNHAPAYLTGIGEGLLAAHRSMPQPLEQQLVDLNTYNREFERLSASFDRLDSLKPELGEVAVDEWLARIDLEYGKADALAIYSQRRSDRLFRWFSYMASSMALLFLIYAKLFASNVLLSLYLAILVLSLAMFYWVRRHHWFSKHLIYRVLAETMRTKFFLHAAGADRLVNATELINLTGIGQFAGFSWIGNLLKNVEPVSDGAKQPAADEQMRLSSVHSSWIRGQKEYFSARVRKLERNHARLNRMKSIMLGAIAVIAVALLLFANAFKAPIAGALSAKDIAIFLMGLLPVWLGVWELYQNKMATRELLWQYRNQLSHFTRAEMQLSRGSDHVRQKEILAQVGKESLMESYLWTIHRYHREYEPPAVG